MIDAARHAVRSRAGRVVLVFLLGVALMLIAWSPMLAGTPSSDGRYFYFQSEIAKAAWRQYGEVSFWNPFDCAGIPMWDHPEAIVASPLFLVLTPASSTFTLLAWHAWHVGIGFLGTWLLARDDLHLSRAATFVGAWLFALGTWVAAQSAGLHATMISFQYAPLLLFAWRRAETSWSSAAWTGALVALMLLDGATYPLPFCVLVIAGETLGRVAQRPRALPRIAASAAIVGAFGVGLSAVRLFPLASRLTQGTTKVPPDVDNLLDISLLWKMFTRHEPNMWTLVPPHQYFWHEYVAYIGTIGVALTLAGVLLAARSRRTRWTVIAGAAAFVLMLGHFASWSPWSILRAHVFPFQSLRVPSRFRHLFAIFVALWIAIAVDRLPAIARLVRRRRARRAASTIGATDLPRVIALGLALSVCTTSTLLGREFVTRRYAEGKAPAPASSASPRFYYGGEGLVPDWMDTPSQNRAFAPDPSKGAWPFPGCRAAFAFREHAAVWTGDVDQARSTEADRDAVTIASSSRTHNTFRFVANATHPGRVLLNSAYDAGWQTSIGTVQSDDDLLAVDVPAGTSEVLVRYRPRYFATGLYTTLASAVAFVLFLAHRRLRSTSTKPSTSPREAA